MDLNSLLAQFINYLESKGRSKSTVIAYKKDIEQLIIYLKSIPNISKLEDINSDILLTYIDNLKDKPEFTLKTVSRKINSLRTFFKFLVCEDKIGINPASAVKHPKSAPVLPRVLSSLEYRAIRDVARTNTKLYTMVELLLQTGIRIGELSRLYRKDVIFNNDGKDYLYISEYSTIPARKIELNQLISRALRDYLDKTANPSATVPNYLFYTKSGKPVLIRNIRTALDRVFTKAGIKNATVNDLRNTFIVYQLQNGLRIERLAQLVGHKKVSTTERYLPFLETKPEKTHNKITPL
jgi:site-specific recombinase XerD